MARNYWLWVTDRRFYEISGSDAPDLAPGTEGWWTCSPNTQRGDLAFLYRTSPKRDIAYLLEARTDASPIEGGEFGGDYACEYVSKVQFVQPLSLSQMKTDPLLASWGPIKANLRRRSFRIEPPYLDRMVELLAKSNPTLDPKLMSGDPNQGPSADILRESEIRRALATRVGVLEPKNDSLALYQPPDGRDQVEFEVNCPPVGFIDLLCRDTKGFVVVEIKRDVADTRAVGQLLGYMGWIAEHLAGPGDSVRGVLVAKRMDAKTSSALGVVPIRFRALGDIGKELGIRL